jgi:hypothetical protein
MRSHPHLYELNTWAWLDALSRRERRLVTLANVPERELDNLAERGFDLIFLMGIWRRSAIGRQMALTDPGLIQDYNRVLPDWRPDDVAGSPYSIQAYEPDPRMGGWDGLDLVRAKLSRRGLALILDFVPNHTGFDHAWVREAPDRYVHATPEACERRPEDFRRVEVDGVTRVIACGRDPNFPPWRDVAQVNYFNPDAREAMIAVLASIAPHCDGVRCDMAMLLLNEVFASTWGWLLGDRFSPPGDEFWPDAIVRVPQLLYIAEVYWGLEWRLQQHGFQFTYDKRLLDRLRDHTPADVRTHLQADAGYANRLVRFIENHDEARSAVVFGPRLPAAATVAATVPGLRLFYQGQLEGRRVRVPVQLGRWPEEPPSPATERLYAALLRTASGRLFHEGQWRLLNVAPAGDETHASLVAYAWRLDDETAIVVANLASASSQGVVTMNEDVRMPPEGVRVRLDAGVSWLFSVSLNGTLSNISIHTIS